MPSAPDIDQMTATVLWGAFALSVLFGAIVHRTRYCTMGAIADVVTTGDATRLRQWALAAGVAVIGFGALAAAGWIEPGDSIYAGTRWMWLSALVGGALFGIGMVLASGCGSKTLIRLGAGNLKALVVFVVMALAAYATMRGITAVLRDRTVDQVFVNFNEPATVGHLAAAAAGWPVSTALLGAALLVGLPLTAWALAGRGFITGNNLLAGLGVGGVIVVMWWLSGHVGHLATRSGRMEAMTFTGPLAHTIDWVMFFSDSNQRLSLGVASVAGVAVGAGLHALLTGQFRWEGFRTTEDLANHLIGATLMGVGGVTALGCTIGQGRSGVSNLSLTSFTAVAGIAAGAVAALKYQMWRLERAA